MKEKFDGITLFDNVISPSLAKSLINYIDTHDNLLEEKYGDSRNVQCEYINLSNEGSAKELDSAVFKAIGKIINLTYKDKGIASNSDTGYCLRKIHGKTRRHTDGIFGYGNRKEEVIKTDSIRNMSVIVALNDDYEDGEFYFPFQDKKIRLKKYQAIAFPPYWTHPHEVSAPKEGTYRYTINTWLCE
jgi:hypothetical protein